MTALAVAEAPAATPSPKPDVAQHSDPLNFDPVVREGFERFYILDFDGALSRFEAVLKAHPQEPIAYGYVQMATVFRELYHQDLLDTTYYAHDLPDSKRNVPVPAATRQRIEDLTNTGIRLADDRIRPIPMTRSLLRARVLRGSMRRLSRWWTTACDGGAAGIRMRATTPSRC